MTPEQATIQRRGLDYLRRAVVRKNSIRLPSGRDVGTYLLGFLMLRKPKNQSCEH